VSDVLFGSVWRLGGDAALRVLRVVLALAVVVGVWHVARRTAVTSRDAALATGLVVLSVAPFLRERPQVVSLLFVCWLSLLLQRVLAGARPPLVTCVGLCWLWANVHGMWVLLPVGLLASGVLVWCCDRTRVSLAARCVLVAFLSWAVVLATPVGPRLAWWPVVVRRAAAPITEWQPTVPTHVLGIPLLLIVAALVVRWTRASSRVPTEHVVFSLAIVLFGLLAFRDVAPAAVLLLPEVARRWGAPTRPVALPLATPAAVAAAATGLLLAGTYLALGANVSSDQPVALVDRLAQRTGEIRLLNHYDVGGLVTGTASPPARVAIDGRTDIWPASFVRRYINALNGSANWRPVVDELRPDAALLPEDSEIARGLVLERHWHVVDRDGRWQLLEPPP
jgi:hypothetical protein